MKEKKKIIWWQAVLVVGTLLAAVLKLYIGMDNDESYIVTMGVRLLKGGRLFDTMWELHMTSALPVFLAAALFSRLTGSLDGIVVFTRLCSIIAQFATAAVVYHILKKYKKQSTAFAAAFFTANFLPRATQNLEYGLLEMLFLILCCVLLFDIIERAGQKQELLEKTKEWGGMPVWVELCTAAVCYALAVLSYPTILVSAPVFAVVLFWCIPEKKIKVSLIFWGTCAVCAVVFLLSVFSYLPPLEFLENLHGILSDGTHSDTLKMQTYGTQLLEIGTRAVLILAVAGGFFLLYKCIRKKEADNRMFAYLTGASMMLILMGLNLTGIRPSGPIGFQTRYLVLAVLGGFCFSSRSLFAVFFLPGIAVYAGTMLGSNMGFEENASFLYLCILCAVMVLMENWDAFAAKKERQLAAVCMGIFFVGIVFSKGYFVRVTGTSPANVTEPRERLTEGPLKGIYVDTAYKQEYLEKTAQIQAVTTEGDTVLILTSNAIYNLIVNGSFTSATCISTPVYNEEWVQYYEKEKHPFPTVILLDKEGISDWEKFAQSEFGAYLIKSQKLEKNVWEDTGQFYVLRLG